MVEQKFLNHAKKLNWGVYKLKLSNADSQELILIAIFKKFGDAEDYRLTKIKRAKKNLYIIKPIKIKGEVNAI